uniref:Uncharacterized protein n=1 Tax=Rhizophora mucronata TaxID=61149 RepID=A0A2P2N644_RHIMU
MLHSIYWCNLFCRQSDCLRS